MFKNITMDLTESEKHIIAKKFNLNKDAEIGFPCNIDILVKLGINLEIPVSYTKENPLTIACNNGHFYFVERILKENININYGDKDDQTGLHLASQKGYKKIVEILLENNADIHCRDKLNQNTPVMLAAMGGHLEIVKMLHLSGANLNDKGQNGYNVFLMAIKSGNEKLVKYLIDKKININYQTSLGGTTGLMVAAEYNYKNIVKLLLDEGADRNLKNFYFKHTAEDIAKINKFIDIINLFSEKNKRRKII